MTWPPRSPADLATRLRERLFERYERPCECEPVELREDGGHIECASCGRPLVVRRVAS